MRIFLTLLTLSTLAFSSCSEHSGEETSSSSVEVDTTIVPREDFTQLFKDYDLRGSILIYNPANDTYYCDDESWARRRHSPASTFKIPNSIVSLENGIVESDSSVLKWDGEERNYAPWNQDLSFRNALQLSCVPCYQELARKTGVKRMKATLEKIAYPGMVFDSTTLDKFWLEGPSAISQFEQIEFLTKLFYQKLAIKKSTDSAIKRMLFIEQTPSFALSGKTGWGMRGPNNNGWFVGYAVTPKGPLFFANNMEPDPDFSLENWTSVRKEISIKALELGGYF